MVTCGSVAEILDGRFKTWRRACTMRYIVRHERRGDGDEVHAALGRPEILSNEDLVASKSDAVGEQRVRAYLATDCCAHSWTGH